MSYYRKCEDCGCTLDPGEGRICESVLKKCGENRPQGGATQNDTLDKL